MLIQDIHTFYRKFVSIDREIVATLEPMLTRVLHYAHRVTEYYAHTGVNAGVCKLVAFSLIYVKFRSNLFKAPHLIKRKKAPPHLESIRPLQMYVCLLFPQASC